MHNLHATPSAAYLQHISKTSQSSNLTSHFRFYFTYHKDMVMLFSQTVHFGLFTLCVLAAMIWEMLLSHLKDITIKTAQVGPEYLALCACLLI